MTSTTGSVVDRWAVALAERTHPAAVPIASATAREFARGGPARRRLLSGGGEQTGGFGLGDVGGDFAHLLNALLAAGRSIVDLLDHQAVGNVAGVCSLLLALRQQHGRRRQPDVDPELDKLIETAITRIASELQKNGHRGADHRAAALEILTTMAGDPASAREFLATLDPTLAVTIGLPAVPAPPWVWVFLAAVLALGLPGWWGAYRDKIDNYAALPGGPIFGTFLMKIFLVASSLPLAFLLVGVASVSVPGLRRRWVERRYRVSRASGSTAAEIQAFVSRFAPHLEVRAAVRPNTLARIYPVDLRHARIAIFPAFWDLWAADRPGAEAVLLHEIAHYRQGEHLVVGIGSPFSALLRTWGVAFLLLTAAPVVWLAAAGNPLATPLTAQVLLDVASPARMLILPIAALWLAELTADAWATAVNGRAAIQRVLHTSSRSSWRRRTWRLLDHPPATLRRWLIAEPSWPLLLAAWPAALVARLAIAVVVAAPAYALIGTPLVDLPLALAHGVGAFLRDALPVSLAVLAVLVLWPTLSRYWPRPWDGGVVQAPLARPYLIAAILPALLAFAGIAAAFA